LLADSNNSPTLGETESWLRLHLPTSFFEIDNLEVVTQTAEYSFLPNSRPSRYELPPTPKPDTRPCKLSVSIHSVDTPHGWVSDTEQIFVIEMESLDDTTTFGYAGEGIVPLGKVNLDTIKVKKVDTTLRPLALGYHDFQLAFRDEDEANRVAKALRHAAQLCGAKTLF